jgi:glutathione synthase/RimK-type ligase-like ATP-grasp enzyme
MAWFQGIGSAKHEDNRSFIINSIKGVNMMNEITLLIDYRGAFYYSATNAKTLCSMNVERIKDRLGRFGIAARVIGFSDIEFNDDWSGRVVLYQSAEDPDLQYKSYIEDTVLFLSLAGAHVVPEFHFLRAHHNKVFLEMLRKVSRIPEANTLSSQVFGTYEDFTKQSLKYPCVVKQSYGYASLGVKLLPNKQVARRVVKKMSKSRLSLITIKELVKRWVRKNYVPYSLHRKKIITQEFIPDLTHDYKVLLYGNRVFVVRREVRDNDFRASGSGRLSWPNDIPNTLLDFAWRLYSGFDVPHISLDIAEIGQVFHLIEAQFVDFGTVTLEGSDHHWQRDNSSWKLINGRVELESTFVEGIVNYSKKKGWFPA